MASLIVLGSSGGYSGAGKACSSFLIQTGDSNIVLDIGPGSLSNLLKFVTPDDVDAVIISHMHYDHYSDIYGLLTARRFWKEELGPLKVLAPAEASKTIISIISDKSRELFAGSIDYEQFSSSSTAEIASCEISCAHGRHAIESWILRIKVGERVICYSGDTDYCEELAEMASNADLFLCEATFTSEARKKEQGHLYAVEAGSIAAVADVKKLVLTHIWPTYDPEIALTDASSEFGGPVQYAVECNEIELG